MQKLDELIDKLFMLRERKRGLQQQIKEVDAEYSEVHTQLLSLLSQVGTDYARGALASATVTEQVVPHIDDWEAVAEWVKDNDGLYLMHRRISVGPWRELRNAGVDIPGVEPFTKRDISLRRLGD